MISFIKNLIERVLTALVSFVKGALTFSTLISLAVLFVLFFIFLYQGDILLCLVCLAGIYTFIHLNKVL